ncbi:MAG: YbaB/EbfC family nucleoid-associated protein [Holosporales bacterium]|jgi:DNA-binding YbaB/EbfC family protein|nr:YbaB/EbfC family nucleoid-associated protein [Holosporales bacterium]
MNNNMQKIFAKAQALQAKIAEAQKKLEKEEVSGSSCSGMVSVVITLKGDVKSISIAKEIINPDEKDILEDLILVALNDAKSKADMEYEKGMKEASGGIGIPGL